MYGEKFFSATLSSSDLTQTGQFRLRTSRFKCILLAIRACQALLWLRQLVAVFSPRKHGLYLGPVLVRFWWTKWQQDKLFSKYVSNIPPISTVISISVLPFIRRTSGLRCGTFKQSGAGGLRYSGILRSMRWCLFTDVLEQLVVPVLNDQEVQEKLSA